jgi:hypothetical protein
MSMKNSSNTIGNQTRDILACRAVPQPTAPPHTANIVDVHWQKPGVTNHVQKKCTLNSTIMSKRQLTE